MVQVDIVDLLRWMNTYENILQTMFIIYAISKYILTAIRNDLHKIYDVAPHLRLSSVCTLNYKLIEHFRG